MDGKKLLDHLLDSYCEFYDVKRDIYVNGKVYDGYAGFNATTAKYVLIEKAELWRTDSFEHVFFMYLDCLGYEDILSFREHVGMHIEPVYVRHCKKYPDKNHMYTYLTGIFISENGISNAVKRDIKRFRFMKNYRMGLRGFCEVRLVAFDIQEKKVYGNRGATELVKGFTKYIRK